MKDLEGNGGDLIVALSRHLTGRTEENDGKLLDGDSKQRPTAMLV
jgi:hypothetical protein